MRLLAAVPFLTLAVSVSAHTIFQELFVNGVSQGHTVGIRVPTYDGVSLGLLAVLSNFVSPVLT